MKKQSLLAIDKAICKSVWRSYKTMVSPKYKSNGSVIEGIQLSLHLKSKSNQYAPIRLSRPLVGKMHGQV